jgi:hypothetical protein
LFDMNNIRHDRDAHRQLGQGQAVPLLPGARRRPGSRGHRVGGPHHQMFALNDKANWRPATLASIPRRSGRARQRCLLASHPARPRLAGSRSAWTGDACAVGPEA